MNVRAIAALGALGALAACSDGTGPGARPMEEDAARAAASALMQDLGMMRSSEAALAGSWAGAATDGPAASDPQLGGCSYSLAAQQWSCAVSSGGAAGTVTIQFRNAAGQPRPSYSETETESVRVQASLQGTLSGERVTGIGITQQDYTVSGLAGAETQRSWSGSGASSGTLQVTGAGGAQSYGYASSAQVQSLVFLLPRETHPWPVSGTVTYTVRLTGGGVTVSRTVVVTFTGGSQATLTVGGRTFRVHLPTGTLTAA